jgi:hypothetical protein
VIKKLLKLFWRGGVEEIKPPLRQPMSTDEFSKMTLIGEEDEYKGMSDMVEEFGEDLKLDDVDSVFDALEKKSHQ